MRRSSYTRRTRGRRRRPLRYKRRVIRRRPVRRTQMSRRKLLNITSTKKCDTMMPFHADAQGTLLQYGVTVAANVGFTGIWCPSARGLQASNAAIGNASNQRTQMNCFIRGLKENIFLTTNDGSCWTWRRIVFAMKGLPDVVKAQTGNVWNPGLYTTGNGYVRSCLNWRGTGPEGVINALLFRGAANVDWDSALKAAIDTNYVTLLYDKTTIIQSGNASGHRTSRKLWHPINKRLQYGDDENGATDTALTSYSTLSKAGIGDIIVMDYIDAVSSVAGATLYFDPSATWYWHER
uniref:Capsid protein n=1 Tax=Giant panda feces-associated gemycircularvirus TaxID=2864014 RepID=A0A8K1M3Z9_9VIRU|nr:capsid protein [Giant panda feces-associated gemycircularvirus]